MINEKLLNKEKLYLLKKIKLGKYNAYDSKKNTHLPN